MQVKHHLAGIILAITATYASADVEIFTDPTDFKLTAKASYCVSEYDFDQFVLDDGIAFGQPFAFLTNEIPGLEFENAIVYPGCCGGTFNSPPNVVLNEDIAAGGPIVINLTSPAFGIGLYNTSLGDRERVDMFDADGAVLATFELPESVVNFGGILSDVAIARVEIVGISPTNGSIYIDDLIVALPLADDDQDGLVCNVDNCVAASNSDQRDTDNDGYGNVCDADLNNDCTVNAVDLGLIKSVFFSGDADADFNGDGSVNPIDLGTMKLSFFGAPGPSGVPNSCDGN